AAGFHVRETVFKTLDEEMKAAGRGAVSSKGFELSARRIGTLMRDQFNLAFVRSEEHTSELQSRRDLVCRLLLEKKKKNDKRARRNTCKYQKKRAKHNRNSKKEKVTLRQVSRHNK